MYKATTDALHGAAHEDAIDVVLLGSIGAAFSVGNDLDESDTLAEDFARAAGDFFRALSTFPKPIVAVVHGLVRGAGATI
jgi:enoyl-CoA hydratase/carnithine racemase